MDKAQGIIVSAISGYYGVEIEDEVVRARACGVFRDRKRRLLVGDRIVVQLDNQGMNYLIKILSRTNETRRPTVASVSKILLVISAVESDFSLELLDEHLTFLAWKNAGVVIYLSKADVTPIEKSEAIKCKLDYYQKTGYPVLEDIEELERQLPAMTQRNQIWTSAGQSGAGKSALLNKLESEANQETSVISTALNRGKHTTRQVKFFKYSSGLIANTPGFSAIDLFKTKIDKLENYFYDLKDTNVKCRPKRCQHIKEPSCEVKKLIEEGEMAKSHYGSYLKIRQKISENRMPEYLEEQVRK